VCEAGWEIPGAEGVVEIGAKGETREETGEGGREGSIEVSSQDKLVDARGEYGQLGSFVHNLAWTITFEFNNILAFKSHPQ
jgi:hypothetical protein